MLWQGKLSSRSCKSLWQGSGTTFFCKSYLHSSVPKEQNYCPGFSPGLKAGADEIQALERIPLLSMETESGNTAWSINRQCAAALGYSLLQEWAAPTQSQHLGTDQGTESGTNN